MADEINYPELIQQGIDVWNRWREAHPDVLPDLHQAYLFEADLKEANLRGVNLSRACLIGANLTGADLQDADLQGVYGSQAVFEGANLSLVDLSQANLNEAILTNADLSGSRLEGANLSAANLTGACIEDWRVDGSTDFTDIRCNYLYRQRSQQARQPTTGNFNADTWRQFLVDHPTQPPSPEAGAIDRVSEASAVKPAYRTEQTDQTSGADPAPLSSRSSFAASAASPPAAAAEPAGQPPIQSLPPYKSAPYRAVSYKTAPKTAASSIPEPPASSRARVSRRKRLIRLGVAGAGLVSLLIVGLLIRLIALLQSNQANPGLVLGSEVNLASLPCNELPPPNLQDQDPSQVYSSGIAFYGQFEDGIPADGRGIMVFANGDRYDGEFKAGQRHGCGTFTFANGRQYMGQFEADQFHGIGVWELETGDRYIGEFENSRCEGWGTFLFSDGSSKSGTWSDGNLVGEGLSCNRGVTSEPAQTAS